MKLQSPTSLAVARQSNPGERASPSTSNTPDIYPSNTLHIQKFATLVIPEADAAMNGGEMLESLGLIWQKATLEEKHKLLSGMLEAVYVDLAASRSIVGIQPKPPFYPLFEALRQKPEAKVTLFNPGK